MTIDELITKWENTHKEHQEKHKGELEHFCCYWAVENFISDLKSLKSDIQDKQEVEINDVSIYPKCPCGRSVEFDDRFCAECGCKLVRISKKID